ncbi:MAG: hypothetical protein WCO84_00505 [bacterium]
MSFLDFFYKKTPLDKFEEIITREKKYTDSLRNGSYKGKNEDEIVNTALYRASDNTLREMLSSEDFEKLDKINEIENVLNALKKEVVDGRINEIELKEIFESKEYSEYTKKVT